MDRLDVYRQQVQMILKQHHINHSDGVETYTVFDTKDDHYQVITVGWEKGERIYGCLIHVDIKDGKIWIQYDGTEYSIANELMDLGVSSQAIVVAYHPPYARQYTEFAVS